MKNGGVDKRIVKTKAAVHKAFQELVQEKEMLDISISELTERANITRSTFYMYYNTVADVRDDIENEIVERIKANMNMSDLAASMLNPYNLLSAMAQEILKYDEQNKYILSYPNSGHLLDKINEMVVEAFTNMLNAMGQGQDAARGKYIATFFTAGIIESFKVWYNHQSSLSLEELCRRMSNLVKKGLAVTASPDADD